jgi:hypothetical protein
MFCRELVKNAKNCDHNIDPMTWQNFKNTFRLMTTIQPTTAQLSTIQLKMVQPTTIELMTVQIRAGTGLKNAVLGWAFAGLGAYVLILYPGLRVLPKIQACTGSGL